MYQIRYNMRIIQNTLKVMSWLLNPTIPDQAKRKVLKIALDIIKNTDVYYKKGGEVGVRYKKTW